MHTRRRRLLLAALFTLIVGTAGGAQEASSPPIPTGLPDWSPGSALVDGSRLHGWEARFTMGGAGKDGPLGPGEKVTAAATQVLRLERADLDGRSVWARSLEVSVASVPEPVVRGVIYLDETTLVPIRSRLEQQGQVVETDYAWDQGQVRQTSGDGEPVIDETAARMLEAAAHDVWIAAMDWEHYSPVRIPVILAGGGGQYWAVPRLVGTEAFDIGDGASRQAWVIELDWWDTTSGGYSPGGGVNNTAGSGGKYWVLKNPPAGVPPVVRIRTEQDAATDAVVQMQDGPMGGIE